MDTPCRPERAPIARMVIAALLAREPTFSAARIVMALKAEGLIYGTVAQMVADIQVARQEVA